MPVTRQVKFFRNGRNQAVRIPRELEFAAEEGVMWREGNRLIIEPAKKPTLLEVLARLEPIDEEFPEIDDPPPDPVEI